MLLVDVLLIPQLGEDVNAVDTIVPHVIALVPQEIVPDDVSAEQVIEVNVADSVDTIGTCGKIPVVGSMIILGTIDETTEFDATDAELDICIANLPSAPPLVSACA